jgi:outer membrane protein OmpA-like peptidoglycan-associated protein
VVFFDLDRDQVIPRYQKGLKEFAKKNNNQTLYLMGRASFIGGKGYNKELSGRRVRQVEKICSVADCRHTRLRPRGLVTKRPS